MKKILLTSLAALFAVVSFAQVGVKKQVVTLTNEPAPITKVMDRQSVVKNVKAPQGQNAFAKKNLRRAAISSIDELQGEFIVCNYEYSYDSEAEQLVPAAASRTGASANIEVTGENTIAIYGINGNATETAITATVDIKKGAIIIPANQLIWTYTDKESGEKTDFLMTNASTEGDFTGTIYEGGIIVINEIWFEGFTEGGQTYRNGNYIESGIAPVNGVHECKVVDGKTQTLVDASCNVFIEQNPETKVVTVWNYNPNWNLVVDIDVLADKTFNVPEQVVYYTSNYGEFCLYGVSGKSLVDLVGTVSETELSSDLEVYVYQLELGGWDAGTFGKITLTDGSKFTYPALEIGELVTPPAGLQTKDYPFSAIIDAEDEYTAVVKVGIDGNNVYIQGLDKDLPEAWVKGEYNEDKTEVGFPVTYIGLVGEDEVHYFAAYSSDGPDSLFVDYDADADTYDYGATVMIYKGTKTNAHAYFYNGFFIGEKPTPVVAPEGLETKEMPFTGKKYNSSSDEVEDIDGYVNVGFDGNDVYIQNLFEEVADGWMKGTLTTIEGAQYVSFAPNQYIGNLDNGLSAYIVGYVAETDDTPASASYSVFEYDAQKNIFKSINPILLTRFKNSVKSFETFFSSGLTIGSETDGIVVTKADEKSGNAQMFNIAGQRVNKDFKGLVIKNGKKMVVK